MNTTETRIMASIVVYRKLFSLFQNNQDKGISSRLGCINLILSECACECRSSKQKSHCQSGCTTSCYWKYETKCARRIWKFYSTNIL